MRINAIGMGFIQNATVVNSRKNSNKPYFKGHWEQAAGEIIKNAAPAAASGAGTAAAAALGVAAIGAAGLALEQSVVDKMTPAERDDYLDMRMFKDIAFGQ